MNLFLLALAANDPGLAGELLAAEARWRNLVPDWFAYLDRDGDGHLSPAEFALAPSPRQLRSHWQSGLYPQFGQAGALASEADRDGDGRVSLAELDRYYRRGGAGPSRSSRRIPPRPRPPSPRRYSPWSIVTGTGYFLPTSAAGPRNRCVGPTSTRTIC